MEQAVGMETTLFGGPPELGNMLKLANGQIGFMTIFAHPLFANVSDIIPAMRFAADEILTNKGVWFTRAEQEKRLQHLKRGTGPGDGRCREPQNAKPRWAKEHPQTMQKTNMATSRPRHCEAEQSHQRHSRLLVRDMAAAVRTLRPRTILVAHHWLPLPLVFLSLQMITQHVDLQHHRKPRRTRGRREIEKDQDLQQ